MPVSDELRKTPSRKIRGVFFCTFGEWTSNRVHQVAQQVLEQQPDVGKEVEIWHAGIDHPHGRYEFRNEQGAQVAPLESMDVVLPLDRDVQAILRQRIDLMEGPKLKLLRMNEHGIQAMDIRPRKVHDALRKALVKRKPADPKSR